MIAALALVLVVAQAAPAPLLQNLAPVAQPPAPAGIPDVAGVDRTFAEAALQGNAAELDMARLALERSNTPEVRAFAQKMLTEHMGLADEMLPALQRVLRAGPAQRLGAPDSLALTNLHTLSSVDFDQTYAEQQVGDHLATLAAFRTEVDNGADPQIKSLARKWMPTIQSHLELAVALTQHIGGSSPLKSH
jgi:putative membrane protein